MLPVKSLHVHPLGRFARDCHFKGFPEFEECSSQCFQRELQFYLQGGCSTTELNRHGSNITCADRYFSNFFLLFTNLVMPSIVLQITLDCLRGEAPLLNSFEESRTFPFSHSKFSFF